MKKIILLFFFAVISYSSSSAQLGYDIKINLKNCEDTAVYMVKYLYDKQYMADTCKSVKNGLIEFKGKIALDKGMYALVSTGMVKYFDFFVNESQKFNLNGDLSNLSNTLVSPDNKENQQMFSYSNFMTSKEGEYKKILEQSKTKSKKDSLAFMKEKQEGLNASVKKFDADFTEKNKGTFVTDFLNLRTEKYAIDIPKAKNGRPDSIYQYYYYKNHYLDGINFKDDRIIRVPLFADRIKKYMNEVIVQQPDTIIKELDKILAKCEEGNLVYNLLIGDFTYRYEQNKTMSFDRYGKTTTFEKVFVHLGDNYIVNGKANKVYDTETIAKIKERVDVLRNLLPETKVSDLYLIDTTYGKQVLKMGFDTAQSSKSLTDLYYKNVDKLTPMFKTLYQIGAKYTVLVFWAADCDHCRKEIPKLNQNLKELKGKVDIKVLAIQTKDELFNDWRKFIIENKLDFIHAFDPIHINDLKNRFDINATPVIYLLDKDKKIKGKKLSADQVPEIIKNLESIEKL